ncbi:hypothetical protein C8R43DRAFT_262038 [Mycena crocata]|nr:hypothetical protein C8R43DRAFT_262038 [Mycena crocata]
MSAAERVEMIDYSVEGPAVAMSLAQTNAVYRTACYSAEVKRLVTQVKTTLVVGEASGSFSHAAMWPIGTDNKAAGGDLKFVVVPSANDFVRGGFCYEAYGRVYGALSSIGTTRGKH